jgi:hypothetical protein
LEVLSEGEEDEKANTTGTAHAANNSNRIHIMFNYYNGMEY